MGLCSTELPRKSACNETGQRRRKNIVENSSKDFFTGRHQVIFRRLNGILFTIDHLDEELARSELTKEAITADVESKLGEYGVRVLSSLVTAAGTKERQSPYKKVDLRLSIC